MLDLLTAEETIPAEVMRPLVDHLSRITHKRRLDQSALNEIEAALEQHTTRIRLAGYLKFPKLKVVYFEAQGHIEVVRADLEWRGIRRLIQNVIRRFDGNITSDQLSTAIRRAFPSYTPDDGAAERARVLDVLTTGQHVKWTH